MSTYDTRLDALETEVAMMKRDIVYKLDDTNSSVTILRGVMGVQGRDIRFVINQIRGLDIRLEGVEQDVRAIKEVQDAMGHDIAELKQSFVSLNGRMDTLDSRMDTLDSRMDTLDSRMDALNGRMDTLDSRMDALNGRMDTLDSRMDALDGRIDALEKSFNGRFDSLEKKFDQMLQLLMPPTATDK